MNKSVILITGASAGIGRECANHLATSGWNVLGASRRGTSDGTWRGMQMDVDDDDSVGRAFEQFPTNFDELYAVLACAGWGLAGAAEHTSIEDA